MIWLAVLVLGGAGAVARYGLEGQVQRRYGGPFPLGTLVVNVLGSFGLGLLTGLDVTGDGLLLAGTAALGSFTTFSAWMLESERLAEDGEARLAVANVLGSLAAGLVAALAGWAIGAAL